KGGSQAVTFTKAYLQSGSLILRDSVKILAFNYLPNQPVSQGVNDFLRMTLPQLQFKNPSVQMLTMQNLAPTPFIQCYMEAEGRRELLIDCSHRKRQEIQEHVRNILCKTPEEVAEENLRRQVVRNPANFGYNCKRHCICEVFGQVPCSSFRDEHRRFVEARAAEAAAAAEAVARDGAAADSSQPPSDEPVENLLTN
ncbi:hypothetical protein BOX15_Mlig031831g1, partial [Macrostomum lignano]